MEPVRVIVLKLRAARERKRARGERVEGVKPYQREDGADWHTE